MNSKINKLYLEKSFLEKELRCPFDGGTINIYFKNAACSKCGKIFEISDGRILFYPTPSNVEENTKGRSYEKWSDWRKLNYVFLKSEISKNKINNNVLDVGAGPTQFAEVFTVFQNYVGIDFYPYKFVSVVSNLNDKIPYADGTFDVVVLSNVIEHIDNTELLLSECYRVLKSGGKILATVPFLMRIHQKPYDFNRYTIYKLKAIFSRVGFSDIKVDGMGNPYTVYQTIRGHFWHYVIEHEFFTNNYLNKGASIILKVIRIIFNLVDACLKPVFCRVNGTPDFTIGYSIVAQKNN